MTAIGQDTLGTRETLQVGGHSFFAPGDMS